MNIITKNVKNSVSFPVNLALHKDLILNTTKKKNQIRVSEIIKATYRETL